MPSILLVDDEPQIIRVLRPSFEIEGFSVVEAGDGATALAKAETQQPDLIVLDLGLPDMDGKAVIQALRARGDTPVIVLSARHLESEKIAALDLGANDYVDKPFAVGELLARIRATLRAANRATVNLAPLTLGELTVDLVRRRVLVGAREVHLTPREYDLLRLLVERVGHTVPHASLTREIWGSDMDGRPQVLRVLVSNLRQKIERDPADPQWILTDAGVGYRLVLPDSGASERVA